MAAFSQSSFLRWQSGATTRPVAPYDHNAEHKDGDCAGQTEEAADSEQAPPQQRNGDHEQEHSDGGEILF